MTVGEAVWRVAVASGVVAWLVVGCCLTGCSRRQKAQVMTNADLAGTYTTVRPGRRAQLEMRLDGTYRLTVWDGGAGEPTYTGRWEQWSLKSAEPDGFFGRVPVYKVTFTNWWDVEEPAGQAAILDSNEALVERWSDDDIRILISGRPDYWRRVEAEPGH